MKTTQSRPLFRGRILFVMGVVGCAMVALVVRGVDLQVVDKDFLQEEGTARHLRVVSIAAHRGSILDRNGQPLAVSTPVDSVWVEPKEFLTAESQWPQMAKLLDMPLKQLREIIRGREKREFVYIKRRIAPALAAQVMALEVAGVSLQREYRRYYPAGEVTGHLLGFTNVDDIGLEGIELAYNKWLRGLPGSKRVIKDRLGHIVEDVERIRRPQPGRDLRLTIDRRIQYLAYRELLAAVKRHKARSGSVVVLDARTSEVLAMVNQPAFNPNNRQKLRSERYRNRAITDMFEPGSTMKPFTIATALQSGRYTPDTLINTAPGYYKVGGHTVRDNRNYGLIDVSTVIQKSSNVGASKIALTLPPEQIWRTFHQVGFGEPAGVDFPGESSGVFTDYDTWSELERATLSFGYGIAVTPLQLARAYAVLAGDGRLRPVSVVMNEQQGALSEIGSQVFSHQTLLQVRNMMERVVSRDGTAIKASVPGYHVAGKTGTVRKSVAGGYSEDRYLALFAGMAPVTDPRLVMVVMIDEPSGDEFYGGLVAAPVFARVMAGALRLLAVPPDALSSPDRQVAALVGSRL
ncbi:MAG TPA: penicillin-binding protein 2 [Gammaproteobacteria bacterium]|nr:penicillin-binding protein 2 [Gammaproteobacteria bacterium]